MKHKVMKSLLELSCFFNSGLLQKGLLHSTCIDGVYQQKGTQTPHDQHGLPLDIFEEVCLI